MKFRLLYDIEKWSNINTYYLEDLWSEFFERVPIQHCSEFNYDTDLLFTDYLNVDTFTEKFKHLPLRMIVDHLWDAWLDDGLVSSAGVFVVRHNSWSRINESLWWRSLGYNEYSPNRFENKKFVMLMNMARPHRTQIYGKLKDTLDANAIYSYHGMGIKLTNASDISTDDNLWQRHFDPAWYDGTKFSLVVESGTYHGMNLNSEKTYKPIAFKHPFVVWGPPGTLAFVKSQGFKTFNGFIDESYDDILDDAQRLNTVVAEVNRLCAILDSDPKYFESTEVCSILDHNFNLFYDEELVKEQTRNEIMTPILKYASR